MGLSLVLLLDTAGWDGFSLTVRGTAMPVWALCLCTSAVLSLFDWVSTIGTVADSKEMSTENYASLPANEDEVSATKTTATKRSSSPTLPKIYTAMTLVAFASSVVWMDLIANEAVALMESLGVSACFWN